MFSVDKKAVKATEINLYPSNIYFQILGIMFSFSCGVSDDRERSAESKQSHSDLLCDGFKKEERAFK